MTRPGRQWPGWKPVGCAVLLAGCVAVLHGLGGALAPPPLAAPDELGRWLERREPAEAAVAVVRLIALALAWYLLVATVAGVAARATGSAPLVRTVEALSTPLVRRLVAGVVGLSLAATAGGGGVALAHPARAAAPPQAEPMHLLPPDAPSEPPRMRLLPPGGIAAPPLPSTPPAAAPADAGATVALPAPSRTWTVRPGDHLWGKAEAVLAESWGRAPADAEVDPYWRAMVAANRSRLRDPANSDLVFPGQELAVPAPPERP